MISAASTRSRSGWDRKIGSIDQNFAQGNLESTGQNTDLAIQGDGLFVLSDGSRNYYTRAGNFQLDANGRMVSPANGFKVQGINADSNGVLSTGSAITDIALPFGKKSPARATSSVTLTGNLDARAEPLGTILATQGKVYGVEQATSNGGVGSDLSGLYAVGAANSADLRHGARQHHRHDQRRQQQPHLHLRGGGHRRRHARLPLALTDLVGEINNDFGAERLQHAVGGAEQRDRRARLHRHRRHQR